jgi:hypothetical protein
MLARTCPGECQQWSRLYLTRDAHASMPARTCPCQVWWQALAEEQLDVLPRTTARACWVQGDGRAQTRAKTRFVCFPRGSQMKPITTLRRNHHASSGEMPTMLQDHIGATHASTARACHISKTTVHINKLVYKTANNGAMSQLPGFEKMRGLSVPL